MPVDCIAACYCQELSGNRVILIRKFALRQKDNTFERNSRNSRNKQLHYYVAVSYKAGMNALTLPTYFFFCDVKCQKENVLRCLKCLWVQFYLTYLIYLCVFKSLTAKVDFDCLEMAFQLLIFVGFAS